MGATPSAKFGWDNIAALPTQRWVELGDGAYGYNRGDRWIASVMETQGGTWAYLVATFGNPRPGALPGDEGWKGGKEEWYVAQRGDGYFNTREPAMERALYWLELLGRSSTGLNGSLAAAPAPRGQVFSTIEALGRKFREMAWVGLDPSATEFPASDTGTEARLRVTRIWTAFLQVVDGARVAPAVWGFRNRHAQLFPAYAEGDAHMMRYGVEFFFIGLRPVIYEPECHIEFQMQAAYGEGIWEPIDPSLEAQGRGTPAHRIPWALITQIQRVRDRLPGREGHEVLLMAMGPPSDSRDMALARIRRIFEGEPGFDGTDGLGAAPGRPKIIFREIAAVVFGPEVGARIYYPFDTDAEELLYANWFPIRPHERAPFGQAIAARIGNRFFVEALSLDHYNPSVRVTVEYALDWWARRHGFTAWQEMPLRELERLSDMERDWVRRAELLTGNEVVRELRKIVFEEFAKAKYDDIDWLKNNVVDSIWDDVEHGTGWADGSVAVIGHESGLENNDSDRMHRLWTKVMKRLSKHFKRRFEMQSVNAAVSAVYEDT